MVSCYCCIQSLDLNKSIHPNGSNDWTIIFSCKRLVVKNAPVDRTDLYSNWPKLGQYGGVESVWPVLVLDAHLYPKHCCPHITPSLVGSNFTTNNVIKHSIELLISIFLLLWMLASVNFFWVKLALQLRCTNFFFFNKLINMK